MSQFIHVGFGNIVNTTTQGRKTKAVLEMENGQLVLSALLPETIANRAQAEREDNDEA